MFKSNQVKNRDPENISTQTCKMLLSWRAALSQLLQIEAGDN